MARHEDCSVLVRNLVGAQEIAVRADVAHRQTVTNWFKRYDDFPEPSIRLSNGSIWDWAEIEKWLRRTGRL